MRKRKNDEPRFEFPWNEIGKKVYPWLLCFIFLAMITSPFILLIYDANHKTEKVIWEGQVDNIFYGFDGDVFVLISNENDIRVVVLGNTDRVPALGEQVKRVKYKGILGTWGMPKTHFIEIK